MAYTMQFFRMKRVAVKFVPKLLDFDQKQYSSPAQATLFPRLGPMPVSLIAKTGKTPERTKFCDN